jgi:type I restriction enzyme M protein
MTNTMVADSPLGNIAGIEGDLWEAADHLRANSKLTSSEYCMPVLGVIFLRHAANRFEGATRQIEADQAAGRMPKRPLVSADYVKRRALWLPEVARYDYILNLPKDRNLGDALIAAMKAIEAAFEPLQGVLPKEYGIFDRAVLEDLLKIFNREALKTAGGDVFGRIYEYFLMEFAIQGAQDNGEFFTPPSIVQMIVNVIEPGIGQPFNPKAGTIILDPATGSGGMFVQSSHFVERMGLDAAHKLTFYGQEKTRTTINLAKMNLAVHGLQGDVREANTFYEDVHTLFGKCDRVMANPPFNVDMVDAERVKDDPRLPFGLPGVNKAKKVGNGNYLWISYFWSYLNLQGRAGFVMSSQASSAGHGEKDVRRKIVETGDVDAMIAIRSNFFYTRTVPCELWFFDRGRSKERRGKVLMLDARGVFRKVTRKIYDFSPEQLANLSAIVWLYRGQSDRFLGLVKEYLAAVCRECAAIPPALAEFDAGMTALTDNLGAFAKAVKGVKSIDAAQHQALTDALAELSEATGAYAGDRAELLAEIATYAKTTCRTPPATNDKQHAARKAFDPIAERIKGLVKQADLIYKLAARAGDAAGTVAGDEAAAEHFDRRGLSRLLKDLDARRKAAVDQLKAAAYFHRQIAWLQDRFPDAELIPVPGLVKVVDTKEIEAADWSLTPGRYVGVAPAETDEDFDFEQSIRDLHVELASLNDEAVALAKRIQENFEELV